MQQRVEVVVDKFPVLPRWQLGASARSVKPAPQARSTIVSAGNAANAAATAVVHARNREVRAVKASRQKTAHFVAASIAPAKSAAESRQVGRWTAAARAAEDIF